ncbi:phage tail protein [Photobacterium japonica]|uniref:phage tail-collar fiber domain-containing protein n=1 Tax=Photobacterium japonica TaxID=2910235 RepID=UPI003D131216
MANSTDTSILTAAGKALLAQLNAEEKALVIDKMIFANVPNRPAFPQPNDSVPTDHIVHQEGVEQRGRLSEDSVIYSTTLTSDEGPFEFNWTGAYCSEYDVLVTIDHHALTPKTADQPGVAGNTLVRSVVLEYKDIAEITNITVDASTWQYNAAPRMKKMDDDVAQAIIDQNGKDWFIEDGFLVTPQGSAFNIKAGAGYVSGNRITLPYDRSLQVPNKPSYIYVDVHREGSSTGEWVTEFNFVVTPEEKDDYTDAQGTKHFVCKIAQVLADGSVSDLRPEGETRIYTNQQNSKAVDESTGLKIYPPILDQYAKQGDVVPDGIFNALRSKKSVSMMSPARSGKIIEITDELVKFESGESKLFRLESEQIFSTLALVPDGLPLGFKFKTLGAVQEGLGANSFVVRTAGPEIPDGFVVIDMHNGNYAYRDSDRPLRIEEFCGLPETDASKAIRAMANNPLGIKKFNLNPFKYFWDGDVLQFPDGSVIHGYMTELYLMPSHYKKNTYGISNRNVPLDGLNFNESLGFHAAFTVRGLRIFGNKGEGVTTEASCNAIHIHQCVDVLLDMPYVKGMPGETGGQPGIILKYCTGKIIDPIVIDTDRQNISIWESIVDIVRPICKESRYREPILVSSANPVDYQGSKCNIESPELHNLTTKIGTHVLRFSGKSDGSVSHGKLYGRDDLDAVYITDSLPHKITLFDNDYFNCKYTTLIESNSDKEINSILNRGHNCVNGLRANSDSNGGTLNILEDKYTGLTGQPLYVNYIDHVNITNLHTDGGDTAPFCGNYKTFDIGGCEINNLSDPDYMFNLAGDLNSDMPTVKCMSGIGNSSDDFRLNRNTFYSDNKFKAVGPGIPLVKLGSTFMWDTFLGELRVSITEPVDRDTDGRLIQTS